MNELHLVLDRLHLLMNLLRKSASGNVLILVLTLNTDVPFIPLLEIIPGFFHVLNGIVKSGMNGTAFVLGSSVVSSAKK